MAKGYFEVIHNQEKTDLIFETRFKAGDKVPEEQQKLILEVGNTLVVISQLYKTRSHEFKEYFNQLFNLSKTGVEGDAAQPALAHNGLLQVKKTIVDLEAGRVKNGYIRKLGRYAMWYGLPVLLLGLFIQNATFLNDYLTWLDRDYAAHLMILWFGTMAGVWLSFTLSKKEIGFDDLVIIEQDRLEPSIRLIFTGILAIIFALLFEKNVIQIKLASLSSGDIKTDTVTALLIGLLLGINEKILGATLTQKTANLFSKKKV